MADNIQVKDASAATITVGADDVSSVYYPRHKLSLGADGSVADAVGGSGVVGTGVQRVVLATDVGLPAGESHVGEVGGKTDLISVTLSLDTSAYAAGDLLADTQAITNAVRVNGGTATLQSITVIDEDDQGVPFTIWFSSTNATFGAENSAPSISDANARDSQGFVDIAATDYKDLGGVRIACKDGIGKILKAAGGTRDLYLAVVNGTGTPTFTASGVRVVFGFLQD